MFWNSEFLCLKKSALLLRIQSGVARQTELVLPIVFWAIIESTTLYESQGNIGEKRENLANTDK